MDSAFVFDRQKNGEDLIFIILQPSPSAVLRKSPCTKYELVIKSQEDGKASGRNGICFVVICS